MKYHCLLVVPSLCSVTLDLSEDGKEKCLFNNILSVSEWCYSIQNILFPTNHFNKMKKEFFKLIYSLLLNSNTNSQFTIGDIGKNVSPGRRWWTKGRDPREGLNSLVRVDCYQGCWLCSHSHTFKTSCTTSRESVVVRDCLIAKNKIILQPQIPRVSDTTPTHQSSIPWIYQCTVARRLA